MKYRISVDVGNVSGCQIFEVEAPDAQEAKFKVARGEGEIIEDQLQVQSLEWHTATVIEEVPNADSSDRE